MPEQHQYEARCSCGARWRVTMPEDEDAMATCTACGADTFDLADLGPFHSVGRDIDN